MLKTLRAWLRKTDPGVAWAQVRAEHRWHQHRHPWLRTLALGAAGGAVCGLCLLAVFACFMGPAFWYFWRLAVEMKSTDPELFSEFRLRLILIALMGFPGTAVIAAGTLAACCAVWRWLAARLRTEHGWTPDVVAISEGELRQRRLDGPADGMGLPPKLPHRIQRLLRNRLWPSPLRRLLRDFILPLFAGCAVEAIFFVGFPHGLLRALGPSPLGLPREWATAVRWEGILRFAAAPVYSLMLLGLAWAGNRLQRKGLEAQCADFGYTPAEIADLPD